MYKEKRQIKASEIGFHNHMRIKDLIDVIQDLEGEHIESIEPLSSAIKTYNMGILLNFRYVHIKKWPVYKDIVQLETFPYETKGFYGYRNSLIYDQNHQLMVESYCLGSFINMDTLTPHRITKDVIEAIKEEPKHEMNYVGRKIDIDKDKTFLSEINIQVESSHLDYYQHLNNAYYVEFAYNQIPNDFEFNTVICEYKYGFNYKEVMKLKTYQTNDGYLILFFNSDDNLHVMIEFRKSE